MGFVRNLYPIALTAVITLPGILNGLLSSCFDNVDISDDEKRDGKGHSL